MTTRTARRMTVKRCPFCAELIQAAAIKCRFCGEFLDGRDQPDRVWASRSSAGAGSSATGTTKQPQAEPLSANPGMPGPRADHAADVTPDEADDEATDVLYWARPSIWALGRRLWIAAVLLAVCAAVAFTPIERLVQRATPGIPPGRVVLVTLRVQQVAMIAGGLVMLWFLFRLALLKSVSYEVSADRIEWARGLLTRKIDNLDMFRVIDLKLHRSIWDCLLGVGTVTVITRDDSDPQFDFVKVPQCRYLYDVLKKASLDADKRRSVIHIE